MDVERMEKLGCELIAFETKDRLKLHGALFSQGRKSRKAIVHFHGMTGNFFSHPLVWELARKSHSAGFDLFSANNRGFGNLTSFRKGKKRLKIGTALEKFTDCIKDIDAAISALQKLGYKEFVLCGHSTGCQKITYYQAKRKNLKVKALLLLAPGDDYNLAKTALKGKFDKAVNVARKMLSEGRGNERMPLWAHPTGYSALRFLSYADTRNPECQLFNYGGKLSLFSKVKVPILAMFGSKETVTDKTPMQMLAKLREKSHSIMLETVLVKGADHGFSGKEKEAVKRIIEFLGRVRL